MKYIQNKFASTSIGSRRSDQNNRLELANARLLGFCERVEAPKGSARLLEFLDPLV